MFQLINWERIRLGFAHLRLSKALFTGLCAGVFALSGVMEAVAQNAKPAKGQSPTKTSAPNATPTTSKSALPRRAAKQGQWQSGSEDIFHLLTTRFAEQAGDYDQALEQLRVLVLRVKDRGLFSYAFSLAMEADDLHEAQRFVALWQSAFPADDEAYYALLRVLILRGQEEAAFSLATTILQRQSSVDAVTQLSLILSTSPDLPMRLRFLQRLSERFSQNPYLFYYLGLAAKEEGRVSLALSSFERAKDLDNSWLQLDIMQADTLSSVGRLREARAVLEPLLKKSPEDAALLSAMVDILADNYQFAEAIEFVKRWRLVQDEPQVLMLLAWLYAQEGEVEAAVSLYRELWTAGDFGEDSFWFNSAQAYELAGNYGRAMEDFGRVPESSHLKMQAMEKSALLWFKQGKIQQGQSAFIALRTQFPEYALEHYLVEASQLREHDEAFRAVVKQALNDFPEQVDVLAMQADALIQKDKIAEAEQLYQQILEREPDHIETLSAYGRSLIAQAKRFDEGKALIEQAVRFYADAPMVQDAYAMLLVKEGKYEEALIWLRRAFSAYRRDSIAVHYIEVLLISGQLDLAREVYFYERKGQQSALLEQLALRFPVLL